MPTQLPVIYLPGFLPSTDYKDDYLRKLDKSLVNTLCIPKSVSIWLLGEFNLPDIYWETIFFDAGGRYSACSKTLLEIAEESTIILYPSHR